VDVAQDLNRDALRGVIAANPRIAGARHDTVLAETDSAILAFVDDR
jgi:hypothetical protein